MSGGLGVNSGQNTINSLVVKAMQDIRTHIREVIIGEAEQAGYRVLRILLFGSRARGDERPDSDWDFFVVVDADRPFSDREDVASRICWKLAEQGIYADVFIQSVKAVDLRENDTGLLTYYALKEGVPL